MSRRLFSTQIVDSDAFLDMPPTAQNLYFHLGMRADDDGFVGNPKKILRMVGGNDDDLKVLIMKRFVLAFESGVVVIKHWLIHNSIRKDRYNETQYLEEKSKIHIKENKSYTDDLSVGLPTGNQTATQVKLSKDKIREENVSSFKKTKRFYKPTGEEMRFSSGKWWVLPKNGDDWLTFAGSLEKDTEVK
mgnify:CR=1 FL=1